MNKVSHWVLCALCSYLVFGVSAAAYGQTALDRPNTAAPHSLLTPEALGQALTQRYIKQYSSPDGILWLNSVMERGSIYIPFIREEIVRRNLPAELLYLPVIESDYLSTAKSRSGAVGLWQFMENSIEPFDLRINHWVDERRDFWKATHGALSKLEDNHQSLGDWPLALAAYNAGLGGVSRVIKESDGRNYWELSEEKALKTETIHYVPKLLAVAYIMSCPGEFGVDLGQGDTLEWTRLRVGKALDLDWLAAEAGIDTAILKKGNPELNHNMTPPDSTWHIKVPRESAAAIAAVLERAAPNLPPDNQGHFPQVPDDVSGTRSDVSKVPDDLSGKTNDLYQKRNNLYLARYDSFDKREDLSLLRYNSFDKGGVAAEGRRDALRAVEGQNLPPVRPQRLRIPLGGGQGTGPPRNGAILFRALRRTLNYSSQSQVDR